MNKIQTFLWLSIAAVCLLQNCCPAQSDVFDADANLRKISALPHISTAGDLTPFAINCYKTAVKDSKNNAVISTFGVAYMIGTLYVGAEGITEQEMQRLLQWKRSKKEWVDYIKYVGGCLRETMDLKTQSSLWIQNNYMIKTNFNQTLQDCSFITAKNTNFIDSKLAAFQINSWIKTQSQDEVIPVVDSIPPNAKLALYDFFSFTAKWKFPFDANKTSESVFITPEKKGVKTVFMKTSNDFNYYKGDDFEYVELPYNNEIFSLIVIMPFDPEKFKEFESSLTPQKLKTCQEKCSLTKIEVFLPKFSQVYNWQLKPIIKEMVGKNLFSANCNLSNMSSVEPLFVSHISQMLNVVINETSTNVSSYTGGNVSATPIVTKGSLIIEQFNANRPFIYMIQERMSGTILCMGRYVNPDKK